LWGEVIYGAQPGLPFTYLNFGSDGIALAADGERLYWKSVANRYLYSIPTERLRDRSSTSEVLAQGAINNHGQSGISDGMETDTNGFIYHGMHYSEQRICLFVSYLTQYRQHGAERHFALQPGERYCEYLCKRSQAELDRYGKDIPFSTCLIDRER
jgi:hypothetical protein